MHNAWQLYRESPAATEHPLSHLQFIRAVCAAYYAKYSMSPVERPLQACNRTALARRCPAEVRFDGQGHFIERNSTQIRCAVYNMRVYKNLSNAVLAYTLIDLLVSHTKLPK